MSANTKTTLGNLAAGIYVVVMTVDLINTIRGPKKTAETAAKLKAFTRAHSGRGTVVGGIINLLSKAVN